MARSGKVGAHHLVMRIVAKYLAQSIRHRIVSLTFEARLTGYNDQPMQHPGLKVSDSEDRLNGHALHEIKLCEVNARR
jgi:hypothetical protein